MAQIPMSATNIDAYPAELTTPEDHSSALSALHDSLFDGEVLDGTYRGRPPGVRLLGVTNRRLIMLETTTRESRLALTSIPLAKVTSVSFLAGVDGATPGADGGVAATPGADGGAAATSGTSGADGPGSEPVAVQRIEAATVVAIKVVPNTIYELSCESRAEAREAHDLVTWSLITD